MSIFDGMAKIFARTFGADEGEATYSPPDRSSVVPCRPIVANLDPDSAEFAGKPRSSGKVVAVHMSEVPAPVAGGVFVVGGQSYTIVGQPILELPERAMWRCMTG